MKSSLSLDTQVALISTIITGKKPGYMPVLTQEERATLFPVGEDQEEVRNIRAIAYDCTRYGIQLSSVLTRTELEELAMMDKDYEADFGEVTPERTDNPHKLTPVVINLIKHGAIPSVKDEGTTMLSGEFVTRAQKLLNLECFLRLVSEADTHEELWTLQQVVQSAFENSKVSWLDHEKDAVYECYTLLPKGGLQRFHDAIKQKRAGINPLEVSYNKVLALFNECLTNTDASIGYEDFSYRLETLEPVVLFSALKHAKETGNFFDKPTWSVINKVARTKRAS